MMEGKLIKLVLKVYNIERETNPYYRKSGVFCVDLRQMKELNKEKNSIKGESL
jgi:hypothetical protein